MRTYLFDGNFLGAFRMGRDAMGIRLGINGSENFDRRKETANFFFIQ